MDIVDAGCGVGSIALDLAPTVAPGRVVGIDRDPAQVDAARKSAVERGISNAQFHAASVYELPFPDASFDAVYANAVAQADRRHALPQRQDRGQHAHTATFVPRPR